MENRDWINEYEALKKISSTNPFVVPEGYFDSLTDRIASYNTVYQLQKEAGNGGFAVPENYFDELQANLSARVSIEAVAGSEVTGFTVPDGYFNELAANIQARITIESAVNDNDFGFTVPDGYFDGLADNIRSRIAVAEMAGKEEAGFEVPEGYFENLGEQIQSRLFVEEALAANQEAFSVPEGYFSNLNRVILDKTVNAESKKAKKGIVVRMFSSTAFKYATAACFALAIGGGILISQITSPEYEHNHSFLHKQLSSVPVSDIKDYLQLNMDPGDTQQTVSSDKVTVDETSLRNALQNDIDSVQ